ncbi:MAG: NRDE family protein [Phycisphaerales bacterium]
MCTVSIIPLEACRGSGLAAGAGGYRLVTNRDESHRRVPGVGPEVRHPAGEGLFPAVWPTDPEGGGTWVSVNAAGVTLALLNIYGGGSAGGGAADAAGKLSRGLVIPALAHAPSAADAAAALSALDLSGFRGFRLVAVDRESIIECRWEADGGRLSVAESGLGLACFSSHGRGDRHARARLGLFRRWFADRAPSAAEQDAFHRHQWASRPEISVRMVREDARTVSITSVSVGDDVRMRYEPLSAAGLFDASSGVCAEDSSEVRIEAVELIGKGAGA